MERFRRNDVKCCRHLNTLCNIKLPLKYCYLYKKKFSFHSVLFICRFLKSETSLDFFTLISDVFIKTQILTIMTSF